MTIFPLESVFLQARVPSETKDFGRVLALGAGSLAAAAAERIAAEGFETLWATSQDSPHASNAIRCIAKSRLIALEGMAGDFHVHLETPEGALLERVGFIVAADDIQWTPAFDDYGLLPSDSVMSCATFEKALEDDSLSAPFHVVALCGLAFESNPLMFKRTLEALLRLQSRRRVQTYVFTRNVKVAAWGVERLYRAARESGTLFFKFDGVGPAITQHEGTVRLTFDDPLLNIPLELKPDLVVVDERAGASDTLLPLLRAIPSSPAAAPFLSPASPRFLDVSTPKAGVFALGPARGVFNPEQFVSDIDAVTQALKHFADNPEPVRAYGPPQVDQAKCTTCLTCVRLCPHGAMGFLKRAWADPISCVRCGICAAECPAAAITLPPLPDGESLSAKVEEAARASRDTGKTLAFVCKKSGAQALARCDDEVRSTLLPIEVPCAGGIDVIHLLRAFELGAKRVLVAACHKGACASIYGSNLANERAAQVSCALEQAGIDSARLLFITLAGNSYRDLAEIAHGFHEGGSNG